MPGLVDPLLSRLENYRLNGLDTGPGSIVPDYSGYSLANLPSSICRWLGVTDPGIGPLAGQYHAGLRPRYRQVVLVLVDGLGFSALQAYRSIEPWVSLLHQSPLLPLGSICPSTTVSALTTLWTGLPPSQHGIMGYEMWLKEYSLTANMILHAPVAFGAQPGSLRGAGFNPETFLTVPTLGHPMKHHGVGVFALQPAAIARSGLSTMLLAGAEMLPYLTLNDMWVSLRRLLADGTQEPRYIYAYWSILDELSHRFGPSDERIHLDMLTFSDTFQRFIGQARAAGIQDTLLVVAADHGHCATPTNPAYELRHHPELLADLVLAPSGETRLAYFFLRPGREAHARDYIQRAWPGKFLVLPVEQVLASGLLGDGPHHPRLAERIGDWVVLAQEDAYLWWAHKDNTLQGRHGGLTRDEMLIPFLAFEL